MDLFERNDRIGGQFRLVMQIPGKEEFRETIRYFANRIDQTGVKLHLGCEVQFSDLRGYDESGDRHGRDTSQNRPNGAQ